MLVVGPAVVFDDQPPGTAKSSRGGGLGENRRFLSFDVEFDQIGRSVEVSRQNLGLDGDNAWTVDDSAAVGAIGSKPAAAPGVLSMIWIVWSLCSVTS